MAGITGMTVDKLSEMLGRVISDSVVLVAKNMVLGGSREQVAQILGVNESEVQELMDSQDYKDVHLLIAAQYNHDSVETDLTYDEIESAALRKIMKTIDREKDVDRLVRIATMANKAVRRQKMPSNSDVLDPGSAKGQVRLTLSRRIVERLNGSSGVERSVADQISIHSENVTRPTIEEIAGFFNPVADSPAEKVLHNQESELTVEAIGKLLG